MQLGIAGKNTVATHFTTQKTVVCYRMLFWHATMESRKESLKSLLASVHKKVVETTASTVDK